MCVCVCVCVCARTRAPVCRATSPVYREVLDYLLPLGDRASQVAWMVKNLPIMQETRVRSLAREDSLEKEMATDSNILAWRIPRTEEPGGLQSMGWHRVGHD